MNLRRARVEGTNIVLPRVEGLEPIVIPVDADNNFDLRDLIGDKLPPAFLPGRKPSPRSASGTWASSLPRRNSNSI